MQQTSTRRDVFVQVPADSAYVSVLRTTTAGLAARLDFTLDDIEDLRIAVGEACATVLAGSDGRGHLECSFGLGEEEIEVSVAAENPSGKPPVEDSFPWQVLVALASSATATVADGKVSITLTKRSGSLG